MTLARTADLVAAAVRDGRAVGAFNVIGLEHAEGIRAGAEAAGSAALLQISENAVRHRGSLAPLVAACVALAADAAVPIAVHLDHVRSAALAREAMRVAGVTSVMIDASTLPYDDNVRATAQLAAEGRAAGLWVEAELGEVGGKDGAHAPGVRTDPAEAAAFVTATGVDGLAVAVGSSHAMTDRSASLDLDLIARLHDAVHVPLVLHGSSGVPDDLLAAAVAAGIRKVNIGTALNVVATAAVRQALAADAALVDPRPHERVARQAIAGEVERLCRLLAH